MKRIIIMILAVIVFQIQIRGAQAGHDFSPDISVTYWTQYLGSAGGMFYEDPVIQTSITVPLPNDFYFNFWHSTGFNDSDLSSDYADEIDLTLGWSGAWNEFSLDIGIAYLDIVDVFKFNDQDIIEPYLEARMDLVSNENGKHSLSSFFKTEIYINPFISGGDGAYLFTGLIHNWKLTGKWAFSQKPYLVFDTGVCRVDSGLLFGYNAGIEYALGEKFSLSPLLFKAVIPLEGSEDKDSEAVLGASFSFSF